MADKIVAEYTVKVDKAIKDLEKLAARVDKVDNERKKTQDGFKQMSTELTSSFKKVGAAIGIAFGTQELINFGKEAVKLAAQAEGVERAFKRIGGANADNLLKGLRDATRGTVSDLELMQKAVQASNFNIPLENLASLFKFAQARARETGESVEYLTNSIVLGIGRKSPLILDNLGISAVELRARLKGVGVEAANVGDIAQIIGDIADEELAKMGDQADTTADKLAQLNARYDNIKVTVGDQLIVVLDRLANAWDLTSDSELKAIDNAEDFAKEIAEGYIPIIGPLIKLGQIWQLTADNARVAVDAMRDFAYEAREAAYRLTLNNDELVEFLKLSDSAKRAVVDVAQGFYEYTDSVEDAERATELFNKQYIEQDEAEKERIRNLAFLNEKIKELQQERLKENTTLSRTAEINKELKDLEEERTILLGGMTEAMKKAAAAAERLKKALIEDADDELDISGFVIEYGEEVERVTSYADDLWENHFNELMAAQDKAFENDRRNREQQEQDQRDYFNATLQAWQTITSTASMLVEAQYQRDLAALSSSLEKQEITREQYDQRRAALAKEQFRKQKEFAIIQASINTALGVTNAIATAPNIVVGLILAAVAAAAGAAEIATIASQPTPQFAEGGFIDEHGMIRGRSHKQGGVHIEAEGEEFIVKKKHAKANADVLRAINSGDWEKYKMENIIAPAIEQVLSGGFENIGASFALNNQFNDRNLLRGLDRNRQSERDGVMFLAREIRSLRASKNDRYV